LEEVINRNKLRSYGVKEVCRVQTAFLVRKEGSREEEALLWFWTRWACKKQHYYGFERGEQGRSSILMVLNEARGRKQHYYGFERGVQGRSRIYVVLNVMSKEQLYYGFERGEQGRSSILIVLNEVIR
jgi:hypothetical protein